MDTRLASLAAAFACLFGFAQASLAATDTTSFNVKIVVTNTCDIHTAAATDVDFGTVNSTATNTDTAGQLNVTCTPLAAYSIALSNGQNAYDRLQELSGQLPKGPSLKSLLEKTIRADWYQKLPDGDTDVKGTRINVLSRQVSAYRKAAKAYLLKENPELREVVFKRQRDAFAAQKRKESSQPSARALLDALMPKAN